MARPAPSATTEAFYARLPGYLRDVDETQEGPDYPLLRYLSLLGDQLDEVIELIDRFDYVGDLDGGTPGDTSDLVDPSTADAGWLPWLAQAVGVELGDESDPARRRVIIAGANDSHAAGSEGAMAAQVRALLTGTGYVSIADHYGTDWTVGVITLTGESSSTTPAEILAAATRAKPAGVVLVHEYGITWDELETSFPTWADLDAAGSWDGLVP